MHVYVYTSVTADRTHTLSRLFVTRGQLDNGIPITSWFDDPDDNALIECYSFLVTLLDVDDVRPVIAEQYAAALWM
jgi:hypothetical protein